MLLMAFSSTTASEGPADAASDASAGGLCSGRWPAAFDAARDLVSLHYDCSADPDDFQSAVADRALLERHYGAEWLAQHVIPVAGTFGTNTNYQQQGCERTLRATWGDATGFLRASSRDADETVALRAAAARVAAARWAAAIAGGGQVYVKEGGQSDYTRAVLDVLEATRPAARLGRCVHVVQHSQWNEQTTTPAALASVINRTDYQGNAKSGTGPLADGNGPLMRLRWASAAEFVTAAEGGWLGCAWRAAFEEFALVPSWCDPPSGAHAFSAAECLDFSDTHELLVILRLTPRATAAVDASAFLATVLLPAEGQPPPPPPPLTFGDLSGAAEAASTLVQRSPAAVALFVLSLFLLGCACCCGAAVIVLHAASRGADGGADGAARDKGRLRDRLSTSDDDEEGEEVDLAEAAAKAEGKELASAGGRRAGGRPAGRAGSRCAKPLRRARRDEMEEVMQLSEIVPSDQLYEV